MVPVIIIVKVKVKSKFIKCHKNYTISTGTEALATLRLSHLAISVRDIKQMHLELADPLQLYVCWRRYFGWEVDCVLYARVASLKSIRCETGSQCSDFSSGWVVD